MHHTVRTTEAPVQAIENVSGRAPWLNIDFIDFIKIINVIEYISNTTFGLNSKIKTCKKCQKSVQKRSTQGSHLKYGLGNNLQCEIHEMRDLPHNHNLHIHNVSSLLLRTGRGKHRVRLLELPYNKKRRYNSLFILGMFTIVYY